MGWMHSCRRVAELTTRAIDEPLGLVDRWRLGFHLRLCGDCANVQRQLAALREAGGAGLFDDDGAADAPPRA